MNLKRVKLIIFLALILPLLIASHCLARERLKVIAPSELKILFSKIAASFGEESGNDIDLVYYSDPASTFQNGDIFIASLPIMEEAKRSDIILPGSQKTVFFKRIAIGIQKKNPKSIFSLADLGRSGIRVGVVKPDKSLLGKLTQEIIKESVVAKKLKGNIIFQAEEPNELPGLLISNQVDAVICWDTLGNLNSGKIVIMRLPGKVTQSVFASVIKSTPNEKMATHFVEFISSYKSAKNIFRRYGYSLSEKSQIRKSHFYRNFPSHPFYVIYQVLVQQIVDDYGIKKGVCLDIGCGGGQMLIDMARITELELVGLDIEPEIIEVAKENVSEAGFKERIRFVMGDVHNMPLPDNFADLIISRGSIPFWRDRVRAFKEIYRVLKPGGVTFIGLGGSRYLTDEYYNRREVPWLNVKDTLKKLSIPPIGNLNEILTTADIPEFKIIKQSGQWAEIRK